MIKEIILIRDKTIFDVIKDIEAYTDMHLAERFEVSGVVSPTQIPYLDVTYYIDIAISCFDSFNAGNLDCVRATIMRFLVEQVEPSAETAHVVVEMLVKFLEHLSIHLGNAGYPPSEGPYALVKLNILTRSLIIFKS